MFQLLIIIDDFAGDPTFTRQARLLHTLYVNNRGNMSNTNTGTQKFNAIHPIIRVNATEICVYSLKNLKDPGDLRR